jgi:hypothetical protein
VSHSSQEECDKDEEDVQGVIMVGQPGVLPLFSSDGLYFNGPFSLGPIPNPDISLVRVLAGSGGEEEWVTTQIQVGHVEGNNVIDKLDLMVEEARDTVSLIHPTSVQNRKPLSRIHFPNLVGPKCLRLLEVVNSVGACSTRKKNGMEEGRQKVISEIEQREAEDEVEGERDNIGEANLMSYQILTETVPEFPNSGLIHILGDEDLADVDGYISNRQGPVAKRLEAEEILEIQTDMGLNFVEDKEKILNNLVELEDMDKEKMVTREEANGFQ